MASRLKYLPKDIRFALTRIVCASTTHKKYRRPLFRPAYIHCFMGSNGLASVATTTIEIAVDHAGKRFIRTMQRYGMEMERTELHFDRLRGISTLGKSGTQKIAEKAAFKVDDTRKQIIDFIVKNPGTTQQQIIENVRVSTRDLIHELKALKQGQIISVTGTGRKGNPYLYSPADIQTDKPCYTESVGHAA